jgi:uncharacterized protein YijF (DUF1287 family)
MGPDWRIHHIHIDCDSLHRKGLIGMTLIDEIKRNRASNPIYGGRLADALLNIGVLVDGFKQEGTPLFDSIVNAIEGAINFAAEKPHDK